MLYRNSIVGSLNQTVRKVILLSLYFCLFFIGANAQEVFFSDSVNKELRKIPASEQDSFYYEQGKYFYAFHTRQSYHQAMECYLQSLKLALRYDHQSMILKGYFGIGSVYDANNNIDNAVKYYKLHYEKVLKLYPNDHARIIRALYNLASIYAKGHENASSYIYIKKMEEELPHLNDAKANARYHLLITHSLGLLGESGDFYKYYNSLPVQHVYRDSDLAYGRVFAETRSMFFAYENRSPEAMNALLEELKGTNDSIPILITIIKLLADNQDYEQAYKYQVLMNDVNRRTLDQALYADINYRLLEADNLLKERDNKKLMEKEQQLNTRSAILYFVTFLLAAALLLTYFGFKKIKKHHILTKEQNVQIKKQNATNELMLKEIHHRVKNNLQIISSLIELELTKPSSLHYFSMQEIQIKMRSIALAHQMMYEDRDFAHIDLQAYVENMIGITVEVLGVPKHAIHTQIKMNDKKLNLDKSIPLALALNEMMINTIKHALPHKNPCTITIGCTQQNDKLTILYADNGPGLPFQDLTKAKGTGIRLLRKLAQQMQASISVTNTLDNQMQYTLIFDRN